MRLIILEFSIIIVFLTGCSTAQLTRESFPDENTVNSRKKITQQIKSLTRKLYDRPNDPDGYRRLAHLYRLLSTPSSRAQGLTFIDKAIKLDPLDPDNHMEKGLILLDGRFDKLAEKEFEKVIEIGRNRSKAFFYLGAIEEKRYLKSCTYKNHLEKAINYYKKASGEAEYDYDSLFHLAFCYLLSRRYKNSLASALRCVSVAPKSKEAHLLVATAALRLKKFKFAAGEFEKTLKMMGKEEKNFYEDISFLLPEESRNLYLSSSDTKRSEWNKRFWMENDPTPSTIINERHLEHYSRIFMADMLFSMPTINLIGAYSDRGSAYIRFGPPDSMSLDMGTDLEGNYVSWYYKNDNEPLVFTFMDEFLNGNYHFPIKGRMGEIHAKLASTAPPIYYYPLKVKNVSIYSSLFQARAKGCLTMLEHSIAFPAGTGEKREKLKVTFTIFYSEYNRLKTKSLLFSNDTLHTIVREGTVFSVIDFTDSLLPFEGNILEAIEVRNIGDSLKGTLKDSFIIIHTCEDRLTLSTIKLSIPENGNCTGILDPIPSYKVGVNLCIEYRIYNLKKEDEGQRRYSVTYSIKSLEKIKGLYAKGLRGTILYVLRKLKGNGISRTIISSSFERSIAEAETTDRLKINTKGLQPGPYELVINVKDLVSGQSAERRTTFKVFK